MVYFNDTVKNKAFFLLKDIENLDKKILDMITNVRICRKQCLETVNTINMFNSDIDINYKKADS